MLNVTSLYGVVSLLLPLGLGLRISLRRVQEKEFGPGGSPALARAVAAHRNNVEWVGVGVLALLFAELNQVPAGALHALGAGFVTSRVLHAAGTLWPSKVKMAGATLTYLTVSALLGMTALRLVSGGR